MSSWKPNQHHAALMLASGSTITEAANKVRVHKRTIYNWLNNHDFKFYVDRLRSTMLDESFGVLVSTMTRAVQTLSKLLDDPNSRVQLRAAVAIIDTAIKMRECLELDRRFKEIEKQVGIADTPDKASDNGDNDDLYAELFPLFASADDDDGGWDRRLRRERSICNGQRPRRNGIPPS